LAFARPGFQARGEPQSHIQEEPVKNPITPRPRAASLGPAALLLSGLLGCQGAINPADYQGRSILERGAPIVAISRQLPPDVVSRRDALIEDHVHALVGQGPESFYLAINRADLNKKFFFSAYLKVLEPGGVDGGAAEPMGMRVVTFRVQNNKLFMFDVRDDRATSDTFDPTLVLEAYPLVQGFPPFKVLPGNNNYVLFDPAAGLNRFNPLLTDPLDGGDKPQQYQVDLSYMQGFRQIADGATFQQVVTGTTQDATQTFSRDWAVLGMSLRRYAEGAGFQPFVEDPELPPHYYAFEQLRERNTGAIFSHYEKWNIHPGMKPIEWIISDKFLELAKELPKYDWVGAVRGGIETWNDAFGFPVLKTRMSTPDDDFADDDKNFLIFDRDPSIGYAFAVTRSNPNTGETRGASVYFGSTWLDVVDVFDPPPPPMPMSTAGRPASAASRRRQIGWSGLRPRPLCQLDRWADAEMRLQADAPVLSPKEQVELFIRHVITHEVGHTLGLQHNFKGSLDPAQSSAMEYIYDPEAHLRSTPGPYDVDALKFLYGLSDQPPRQAFCNEDDLDKDPLCAMSDSSDEPLGKFWAPRYQQAATERLEGDEASPNRTLNGLAAFLRAGTEVDQARAWEALSLPFKIGADAAAGEVAHPGFTDRLNGLQDRVLRRLFFDKPEDRGEVVVDPTLEGAALTALTGDLKSTVVNGDKIRGWTVRRTSVDVLKKLQVQAAYEALLAARETLAAARPGLAAPDSTLTDDLLARIDQAIHPYFVK
jgi:hypothetical protein